VKKHKKKKKKNKESKDNEILVDSGRSESQKEILPKKRIIKKKL
jgi:hypothetical protein